MSFDEVFKLVHPIVVNAAPAAVSLGCVKEIAEDVAYLITHGYTMEMAKTPETRAAVVASRDPVSRAIAGSV